LNHCDGGDDIAAGILANRPGSSDMTPELALLAMFLDSKRRGR